MSAIDYRRRDKFVPLRFRYSDDFRQRAILWTHECVLVFFGGTTVEQVLFKLNLFFAKPFFHKFMFAVKNSNY